jgi:hypothetical protein
MLDIWRRNIQTNSDIIRQSRGASVVTVISGSSSDQKFWYERLVNTRGDVFRKDGATLVISTHEETRKGNFLGGLDAWVKTKRVLSSRCEEVPQIAFMSMVFGQGKRLSPFTQSLGNRKPAFPTPLKSLDGQTYLTIADVANMSSAIVIRQLQSGGFRGLIIKWGDEAIIPGVLWNIQPGSYDGIDAVRFVWRTDPNEHLAREKDWVVIDSSSGLMKHQLARQDLESLIRRASRRDSSVHHMGVNLGSLAISYQFLDIACEVLGDDIASVGRWVDWDPYAWMALLCETEEQWQEEMMHEERIGRSGIKAIHDRYPNFYTKLRQVRTKLEERVSRPLSIATLDFGKPFWVDWGLHTSLRNTLESLTTDSDEGAIARDLFRIPHERDNNGNIIVQSSIPRGASIRNSIIIDTVITEPDSIVHDGVVIGGRHKRLCMPSGGTALFCAADRLTFAGPHGIAFRSLGVDIEVQEGGRHTTICFGTGPRHIVSNESIIDYEGINYTQPILGNELSFEEAVSLVAEENAQSIEERWSHYWSHWLS